MKLYPEEAYTPDGELWWEARLRPGTRRKLGDEVRMAAWIAFNKEVGETFTTAEVRANVSDGAGPNEKEHIQRRIRTLRDRDGWEIPSRKYDATIPQGCYRLDAIGWHPGAGEVRGAANAIKARDRREVFARDGYRCVLCGVGSGEPYPEDPARRAVLTAGHVIPRAHGGPSTVGNLRTECSLCNETARANTNRPVTLDEFREKVRELVTADKKRLHDWVVQGYRSRSAVDSVFDDFRYLAPEHRSMAEAVIAQAVGRGNPGV
jgi:hypothetical protein